MSAWQLQIYRASDATLQHRVAALLKKVDSLIVEVAATDHEQYVIVESSDAQQAQEVFRLVRAIDPEVVLMHTSSASRRITRRAA